MLFVFTELITSFSTGYERSQYFFLNYRKKTRKAVEDGGKVFLLPAMLTWRWL